MAYLFVLLGVFFRLAPHLPNATPVAAIALFGGTYLDRRTALVVPLLIMVISDMIIGFHSLILFTWGAFLLTGLIGLWLKGHKTFINIAVSAASSSLLFFLITNFGVWAVPGSWYPHTAQGLINCYLMGLPFFRYTVLGDLAYVGALFGLYEAVQMAAQRAGFLKDPI